MESMSVRIKVIFPLLNSDYDLTRLVFIVLFIYVHVNVCREIVVTSSQLSYDNTLQHIVNENY